MRSPGSPSLQDQLDLTGVVVTADAPHTTRDHAHYLVERGAHYVFTLKENQHRLHGLLDALPWHEIPTRTTETATMAAANAARSNSPRSGTISATRPSISRTRS